MSTYDEPDYDDVIVELPDDDTFTIGQSYDVRAATTLSCKKCGNKSFVVGQGSYFTAISCEKCNWQKCIHNG